MPDNPATPIADADPLCRMGAEELRHSYATRRLSPVEVATAALDRAEAVQSRFNAFTRLDRDGALAAARASEARWMAGAPLSPADGIPGTIKDIVWVEGWPIRYGSLAADPTPQRQDAPAVARMRAAGIVFLGLTTTPEFGWKAVTDGPLTGLTRNPWNPALTPGGSSGGAAVAAATGAGVFHLGTDGGGSIRIPCALTGLSGLKPTYGRVPAYPASSFGTVAHLGPMTRRPADARAMLKAMSGTDPQDWLQGPAQLPPLDHRPRAIKGARIGFWSTPPCGTVEPRVASTVTDAIGKLERLGAEITPLALPDGAWRETFDTLWYCGAATRAAALPAGARAKLDAGLQEIVAAGERVDAVTYIKAMSARAELGRAMEALAARIRRDHLARLRGAAFRGWGRGTAGERLCAMGRLGRL